MKERMMKMMCSRDMDRRDGRIRHAERHTADMSETYAEGISVCISGTREFDGRFRTGGGSPGLTFEETDTVSALMTADPSRRIAVLDFASFTHPGGGFLSGSMAQEEALCHESFLYNVLSSFEPAYRRNRRETDGGLYRDRALLCPDVVFERDGVVRRADVIVCASPNLNAARDRGVDPSENSAALASRLGLVRDIASASGAEVLISGAFGCGVFGQDPRKVAKLSRKAFSDADLSQVVFAVPGNPPRNADAFRREFGGR